MDLTMRKWLAKSIGAIVEKIETSLATRLAEASSGQASMVAEAVTQAVTEKLYYVMRLHDILKYASDKEPTELFHGADDDFWLWLNTAAYSLSADLRRILPGLPEDKNLEFAVVTLKGEENLIHGFRVYQALKRIYEKHRGDLSKCESILDFGCGWGRVIRFFLRDVGPGRLWGVDPWKEFIEVAKQTNRWCHFETIAPLPPTSFSEAAFDLIYSYSVFSHLSEDVHKTWLAESRRILKPGGLFIATTLGRDHIEWISELRKQPLAQESDPERRAVIRDTASLFTDHEQALREYDHGRFCYSAYADYKIAGMPWGDACIPKEYVMERWSEHFNVLEYIADRDVCDQNVIVATRAE
jgi:SAM-dependent methyltransferase